MGQWDNDTEIDDGNIACQWHCLPVGVCVFQMQTEGESGEASSSEVATSLQNARASLEELRLDDAEQLFLQTFRLAQEKSADISCLVQIYTGLAEVCTRRSRGYRQNPLEWLWLCVHGGALLGEAVKLCQAALETELDNQTRDWLSAQQAFASGRSQNLADVVGRTLLNWLREDWRLINPYHALNRFNSRTPLTPSHYPLTGGHIGGMKPYHAGYLSHGFSLESLHEPPARTLGSHFGHANWFRRIQLYCHRRLHGNDVKAIIKEVLSFDENVDSDKSDQKPEPETISEESESVTTETVTTETMDVADMGELSRTGASMQEHSQLAASKVDTTRWTLEQKKDHVVRRDVQLAPSDHVENQVTGAGEGDGDVERAEEVHM